MRVKAKRVIFAIACFCGFVGIFYYGALVRSNLSKSKDCPCVPTVNNVTGIFPRSQYQINLKTNHNNNIHNTRIHLSSARCRILHTKKRRSSIRSHHENLEWYTLPKPTNDEVKKHLKNDDKLEENFLRFDDERSIKRIVNGLAKDSKENFPVTFRKKGMPKKRLPNAIIVGMRKGGTGALLEMLRILRSGEILIKEPYEELHKVEEFLQLPKFTKPEHFVYNETKGLTVLM